MSSAMVDADTVRVKVPAKINLGLAVAAVGDDGYHQLTSVFQAVGLYEDIVAEWGSPGEISVVMRGAGAENLPVDATNLAVKAASLLRERFGGDYKEELGVRLSIVKDIPIAGGMAGGSADAAGALLACSVLWDLDTSPDDLMTLGAELGADVPFCLLGGTALGTGRGDQLVPILSRGTYHWVVAVAEEGLSTPAVYRRFDELVTEGKIIPQLELEDELLRALASGDSARVGSSLRNDLQQPALDLRPELAELLAVGTAAGALGALVSGSGPTCVFLANDEAAAINLATVVRTTGMCRIVRCVTGPVSGARLMS
ncbi:MAG: 4-(cytidine 5'-diphospho)-2-C-methyl-D-erythritol kinase [Propionibacteriaceae bacterium]